MKKIAIVGVEGSGKTVMMAAMGEQWERPDERGYFLSPENAEAFGFSKSVMAILRSGKWPSASSHDEMRHLDWSLQRRQGNNLEKIADISMLDYAGEVYRQAFGGEKKEGYDTQVATLRSHVDGADVLIVLVNLSDIINGSMQNRRTRDAMWLTKSVLDYALGEARVRKPHAAIVFTQADGYKQIIASNGGTAGTLRQYLPHVANLYGNLPIFTTSAIDRTVIGDDGLPIPAPGFQSTGLTELMDWMISIGEEDRREYEMREEKTDRGHTTNVELITYSAPLVHLDVGGHRVQKKSKGWFRFWYFLLFALFIGFAAASIIPRFLWEFDDKEGCIVRNLTRLVDASDGKWISSSALEKAGWEGVIKYGKLEYSLTSCGHHHSHSELYGERPEGHVSVAQCKREIKSCYGSGRYEMFVGYGISGFVVLLILAMIRIVACIRTKSALVRFHSSKWTEAMDKKCFLFAKDGFMLYYHAVCNLFGFGGIPVDYAKAGKLFLLSAKRGVAEALVGLGWMAEKGYGMPQSFERAEQYYEEARSMGAKCVPDVNAENTKEGGAE